MLDEIGLSMTDGQANDLLKRLEHDDSASALAAEVELGLLWAISQVTEIDFHPKLESRRQPEAFCPSLFRSGSAYIEITAVSDDTFSDRDKMERAAHIICDFANSVRTGASKNLYFQFAEMSRHVSGRYQRARRISSDFRIAPELKTTIRDWLDNPNWPDPQQIRLTNAQIDVVIQWERYVHPEGRTFSTMPPIAYDLEDNPVFKRLQKKRSQLSGVPEGSLKCIFLGDAGCNILRDLKPINAGTYAISGESIIWHFLDKSSVHLVAVFSPQRENIYRPFRSPLIWRVTFFDKRGSWPAGEHDLLQALVGKLPRPNYEGYQARSLHRQGAFSPQARGQYLGTFMHVEDIRAMKTEIKFPARLFQELIAGRVTIDQFRHYSDAFEMFESELKCGRTLRSAHLEAAGVDEDDDYLVFEFAPDAAAMPLKKPATK